MIPIKIWRALVCDEKTGTASIYGNGPVVTPGTVLAANRDDGVVVACGEGALRLLELQKAGAKRLPVAQFLAGTPITRGAVFALPS